MPARRRNGTDGPVLSEQVTVGSTPGAVSGSIAAQPGQLVQVRALAEREYVAGNPLSWYVSYPKVLPWAIDDVTTDFGSDLYLRMLADPQLAAVTGVLRASILEEGVHLTSAVENEDDDGYSQAGEIADEAERMLADLTVSFDDILWDMLLAVALGNRVAEQVYALDTALSGKQRYILRTLAVKPAEAVAFVVDAYLNVVGILGRIPGQPFAVQQGTLLADVQHVTNLLPRTKFAVLTFRPKNNDPRGTALDPETPIPTPDGWRTMDDLQVGDKVFDEQGRIRYVVARKDWDDRPCYRVTFGDGSHIIADENHLWAVQKMYDRTLPLSKGGPRLRVMTTRDLAQAPLNYRDQAIYSIPWAGTLDYPPQHLPLHPYFLGLWLGDGTAGTADINCHADDLQETMELIRACGYSAREDRNGLPTSKGRRIRVGGREAYDSVGPVFVLRMLGVKNNKHIPACYLRGSVQQRRDLLAGLMDSDGSVDAYGRCVFSNTNRNLIDGVAGLVRSLGVGVSVRRLSKPSHARPAFASSPRRETWEVDFTAPWSPFRLARKAAKTRTVRARMRHYIRAVTPEASRRTVCIETDAPSHLYLAGPSLVPTHNSVLRAAYDPWNQKQQLKKEFLKYLTQFASPSLAGFTAPNAETYTVMDSDGTPRLGSDGRPLVRNPEDDMLDALVRFQNGSAAAFPNGADIRPIEMSGDGSAFLKAFEFLDRQITKAILHQTLATEEGIHQTRASTGTHKDVLDTIIRQGKRPVERMVERDILQTWVRLNWGEDLVRLTPKATLGTAEQEDRPALWTATAALQTSGYFTPDQLPQVDEEIGVPVRAPVEQGAGGRGQATAGAQSSGEQEDGTAPAQAAQGQQGQEQPQLSPLS